MFEDVRLPCVIIFGRMSIDYSQTVNTLAFSITVTNLVEIEFHNK